MYQKSFPLPCRTRAELENVMVHEATIREQSLNGVQEPIFGPYQKPIKKEAQYIGRSDDYILCKGGKA